MISENAKRFRELIVSVSLKQDGKTRDYRWIKLLEARII